VDAGGRVGGGGGLSAAEPRPWRVLPGHGRAGALHFLVEVVV